MSTITDAVEKKKQEEQAKQPKIIDINNPPIVAIPRDNRQTRTLVVLIIMLAAIGIALTAGYFYQEKISEYLTPLFAGKGNNSAPVAAQNRGSEKESKGNIDNVNQTAEENKVSENAADENKTGPKEEASKEEFPQLTIDGIYHDPLDPEVLINGQWLKTGDTIDDVYIVEILSDKVRVRFKGKEKTLLFR